MDEGLQRILDSAKEAVKKLKEIKDRFPDHIMSALAIESEIEATEVKKRTPVYVGPPGPGKPIPGLLRASVHVEGPFREGKRIFARIVAGGAAGAYALRQHEETEWFHVIGQAKYIESVIMESRPFMAARIAARIDIKKLRT